MANEVKRLRCPNCGSPEFSFNAELGGHKCAYCDSFSPVINDVVLKSKIEEATTLRNRFEFDESLELLEEVQKNGSNDAEMYFSKILARYGVTYVDEQGNGLQIPTLSRASEESIMSCNDCKACLKYADSSARKIHYEKKLKEIEQIRSRIIQHSKDQLEKYDVFICYKKSTRDAHGGEAFTRDSMRARKIYDLLTSGELGRRYKTFFAEETLDNRQGQEYEPIIYNALMSAKVMIVIAASEPSFVDAPWVRNEWARFKALIEADKRMGKMPTRFLIPVLCDGFRVGNLPARLTAFQAMEYDGDFNKKIKRFLDDKITISGDFVGTTVTAAEVKGKKVSAVEIARGRTFGQITALNASEQASFDFAISDMKNDTPKHYKSAYKKLQEIVNKNQTNYLANWNMVLCCFYVNNNSKLKTRTFANLKKEELIEINRNIGNSLGSADENQIKIISPVLQQIFINTLSHGLFQNISDFLDTEYDIFNTIISFLDIEAMYQFTDRMLDPFIARIKEEKFNGGEEAVEKICEKVFVKVFSNHTSNATDRVCQLYNSIGDAFTTKGKYKSASYYFDKALELDEYDADTLWNRFKCSLEVRSDKFIVNKLLSKNYVIFDINNKEDKNLRPDNLYSVLVKMLQGGYDFSFNQSNYFEKTREIVTQLLCEKKSKFAHLIHDSIVDLALNNARDEDYTRNILIDFGTKLLHTKAFKKAASYFQQAIALNNLDSQAYWGLMKAELKISTNFGLLIYKKRLNDNPNFKKAYEAELQSAHSSNRILTDFYSLLERIKTLKRKQRNLYYRSFQKRENDCINNLEKNDSITSILKMEKEGMLMAGYNPSNVRHPKNKNQRKKKKIIPIIHILFFTLGTIFLSMFVLDYIALSFCLIGIISFMICFNKFKRITGYGDDYNPWILFITTSLVTAMLVWSAFNFKTNLTSLLFMELGVGDALFTSSYLEITEFVGICYYIAVGLTGLLMIVNAYKGRRNVGSILAPLISLGGLILFNFIVNLLLSPDVIVEIQKSLEFGFMNVIYILGVYLALYLFNHILFKMAVKRGD